MYKLKGKVQHYAWGGYYFIPQLLGIENSNHQPFAEYWMGIHPLAPSVIIDSNNEILLSNKIAADPENILGKKIAAQFGNLPFLFKILDVKDMLSIQVHPSKAAAEKGFDEEEKKDIPQNAPHRNYKDRNDKPEMMLALSEFWLLHGFKTEEEIIETVKGNKAFEGLSVFFENGGYASLFEHIMKMPQHEVNRRLLPLVNEELQRKLSGDILKNEPGWWVCELYKNKKPIGDFDCGIFSLYLLNIVEMQPGQAIFQGAGLIHAYLEGQNLELMTNSDNVLRGGLTQKHIDVDELLQHTLFEATVPKLIQENKLGDAEINYPLPVESFALSRVEISGDEIIKFTAASPEIWLITEGNAEFAGIVSVPVVKGDAIFAASGEDFCIRSSVKSVLYRAFVPV